MYGEPIILRRKNNPEQEVYKILPFANALLTNLISVTSIHHSTDIVNWGITAEDSKRIGQWKILGGG